MGAVGALQSVFPRDEADFAPKWNWLLFILFLPFTEPQVFKYPEMSGFDDAFAVVKACAFLVLIALYVRRKPTRAGIVSILLCGWMGLSTLVMKGSIVAFLGPAVGIVATFMVFEMVSGHDCMRFVKWIRNLLTVYFIINLFTVIIRDVGIDGGFRYFLGMDNRWWYFFLPWVATAFMVAVHERGEATVGAWAIWLASFFQLLYVWSVGAMVAMALWPLFWKLFTSKRPGRGYLIRRISPLFFIVLAANILLVTNAVLPLFKGIIVDVFHKDMTLAGRVYLWDTVLRLLEARPLTGMGSMGDADTIQFFYAGSGFVSACMVNHPHNIFLYYAFKGGVPAMLMYIYLCWLAVSSLEGCRRLKMSRVLICALSCYFSAALVDSMDFSLMHMLLALSYFINRIDLMGDSTAQSNISG